MLEADYFARKRQQLGLDRADTLTMVQAWLDERFPEQTRAKRLHRGTLRIITPSAAVASELRMRQLELLAAVGLAETRLAVTIQSLN